MTIAAAISVICTNVWCAVTTEVVVRLSERPAGSFARTPVHVVCDGCREEYFLSLDSDDAGTEVTPSDAPAFFATCRPYLGDDIDWDEYDPPANPYDVFRRGRESLGLLLKNGGWAKHRTFQQMVLVQHFSLIEAFLADALIGLCQREGEVLDRMVSRVDELRTAKVGLQDILKDGDIVRNRVTSYLRGLQFHNFPKADALYNIAIGTGIMPKSEEDRGWLGIITGLRHDCVHRNGFDKDGDLTPDLQEEIRIADRMFLAMAERVQDGIARLDRDRPFRHNR
ncbi:hypothetical protein ASD04_17830 [Devosia sp. Root436]|uniref:hypothetical protein n=1 Tax=Devosia sp. Root436 TaxID=1736537 RepID=UPI0006FFF724|nr:hypothetical protein [Devosia sp. Root436]KQX34101.1 hypothetical protein ASD04_17830 [Devosia sp. Root436]